MILLRKENDLLKSLIGKSFNQKSKFEAEKILSEIHSKAYDRSINKNVMCYVTDKNEILGLGGSTLMKDKNGKIISNLILDQFGLFLAGVFKFFSPSFLAITLKDAGATSNNIRIYNTGGLFNNMVSDSGVNLLIGSGNTAPTRQDFEIETFFGTAPESTPFSAVSNPVFNSGLGNFKVAGIITAGGSGTINESVLSGLWQNNVSSIKRYVLFRDIISPAVSFIAGQSIALEYTVQL